MKKVPDPTWNTPEHVPWPPPPIPVDRLGAVLSRGLMWKSTAGDGLSSCLFQLINPSTRTRPRPLTNHGRQEGRSVCVCVGGWMLRGGE